MGVTDTYGIPWPENTALVRDGAAAMRSIAEATDDHLTVVAAAAEAARALAATKLNANAKAVDSDKLDGLDSTAFLLTTGKAADSELLDGLDSSAFLRTTGKAADSELLDGLNSTYFYSPANPPPSSGSLSHTTLWIPAEQFWVGTGTPVLSNVGALQTWDMDSTVTERIYTTFAWPEGWRSTEIQIYSMNRGAGSGTVSWGYDRNRIAEGTAPATPVNSAVVDKTYAAGTALVIATASYPTTNTFDGQLVTLGIARRGNESTDTLPNDVGVIGVRIRSVP